MRIVVTGLCCCLFLLGACRDASDDRGGAPTASDPDYRDSLETELTRLYGTGKLPGFAVSVFTRDSLLYQRGFGYANLERKLPYTPRTVQMIASITKTVVGVALMLAVRAGELGLDDDVNDYLDFRVVNPNHPEAKITPRQLAMHTSGIRDSEHYARSYLFDRRLNPRNFSDEWTGLIERYNRNRPVEMEDFLEQLFTGSSGGRTGDSFTSHPPGTRYEYSNVGASLLALVLEGATGEDFRTFTQNRIFRPLGMAATGWERPDSTTDRATYYREDFFAFPNYTLVTYPDGGLFSSVADLTLFLQEVMAGTQVRGRLLPPESYREMLQARDSLPDAIGWDISIPCCIGHPGNDFGTSTLMYFDREAGVGRILFANVSTEEAEQNEVFFEIFNTLFRYDLE